jgi:hypothetical protein
LHVLVYARLACLLLDEARLAARFTVAPLRRIAVLRFAGRRVAVDLLRVVVFFRFALVLLAARFAGLRFGAAFFAVDLRFFGAARLAVVLRFLGAARLVTRFLAVTFFLATLRRGAAFFLTALRRFAGFFLAISSAALCISVISSPLFWLVNYHLT